MTSAIVGTSGYSIFCDDIREEINSKTSLIGMYSGEMLVVGQPPLIMPQLCYMCKMTWNPAAPPQTISIILRRYNAAGEKVDMGRIDFPPIADIPVPPMPASYGPGEPRLQAQAALKITPLPIEEDFTIRSFMVIDGTEKPIGSIAIRLVDSLP